MLVSNFSKYITINTVNNRQGKFMKNLAFCPKRIFSGVPHLSTSIQRLLNSCLKSPRRSEKYFSQSRKY